MYAAGLPLSLRESVFPSSFSGLLILLVHAGLVYYVAVPILVSWLVYYVAVPILVSWPLSPQAVGELLVQLRALRRAA